MARGMPLGLMPGMRYDEGEASLREGDSVLFYSDGLAEAHDPKGEMFSCTPSLERDGSRRTTSPFLRSSILRPEAEPPRTAATKLSAKIRRRPLCSLADHRNGTFNPDLSFWPPYTGQIHAQSAYSYHFSRVSFPDLRRSRHQQMRLPQEIGYRGAHNTGANREA